ncbi:hypothetical protein OEIGOIKO_04231 [Streptomyces chrestomyceticus JCM 4735]|uniref:Uncharacterized protein n=1 Tax=Streptomyces chrestomyceticus JCM 4735 TaxID=1306181 RepID=A0A7U9KXK0_9ACTN|nr:hypothetical protein OEIGOIKO_04231 [Streptomyces chrestomyceticus JCM 4735]
MRRPWARGRLGRVRGVLGGGGARVGGARLLRRALRCPSRAVRTAALPGTGSRVAPSATPGARFLRAQDLLVGALEPRPGADAQFLVEQAPGPVEPLHRVRLPSRTEQRAHQLGDHPLPQRVVDRGRVEDRRGLFVLAERAVRPGQRLGRGEPLFLQRVRGGGERRAGDRAGEGRAAPQAERLAQQGYRVGGGRLGAGQGDQFGEAVGVDQLLGQAQQVRRAVGGQFDAVRLGAAAGQCGAQPRDMALDDGTGVFGWFLLPQGVDQLLQGNSRVGLQQQQREHAAPFGGPERQLTGTGGDGYRAQQGEVQLSPPGRPSGRSPAGAGPRCRTARAPSASTGWRRRCRPWRCRAGPR